MPPELVQIEQPAATPPPEPQPKRNILRLVAFVLLGALMLGGLSYGAVKLFGGNKTATPSPSVTPGPPVTNTERAGVSGQPLASSQLEVTALNAQNADIGTLLVKALQVTSNISLKGDLSVTGSGSFGGSITAANFRGDGALLTGVDAATLNGQPGSFYRNLSNLSGTLRANQLPGGVAFVNGANAFTASNTFATPTALNGGATIGTSLSVTSSANIASLTLETALPVSSGGTGLASVGNQAVLYGTGGTSLAAAAPAGAGLCLLSGASDIQWGSCSGGGGGVASLDGLTGVLAIANTTGSGATITINDATTAAKGIASFNGTNFTVTAGSVNTIQNIATSATPTFGGLTLTGPLGVASGGTGAASLTSNGVIVGAGTGALSAVTAAGAGLCLISNAGAPSFQACPGGGAVTSVNGQTAAVTIANASGSGGTITVQDASTAQKGLAQFNATNFSAAAGIINTIQSIAVGASPTFAGINTNSITPSAALTVGATGQTLTLQGSNTTLSATNGANVAQLTFVAPTANVTYRLQTAAAGTYDVCTTAGNCVGTGGSVSTAGGSANVIPKYTSTSALGPSLLTDDGAVVTVGGDLSVTGISFTNGIQSTGGDNLSGAVSAIAGGTGAIALTARGVGGQTANLLEVQNSSGTPLSYFNNVGALTLATALTVGQGGTGATNLTSNGIVIGQGSSPLTTVTAGGSGLCLMSTVGAPTFSACPGGGGVASLNSLTGALTVANASTAGSTITIDDATTAAKGIASFNATNFSVTSGAVNTIQNISTGSTPTFAGVNTNAVTPSSALTVGATGQAITLQGNASSVFTATGSGFTTTLGFTGSPTGAVTYQLDRAATPGTYTVCTTAGNCTGTGGGVTSPGGTTNRIPKFTAGTTLGDSTISDNGTTVSIAGILSVNTVTPTGAFIVGATAQNLTLQGAAVSLTSTNGGTTNALTFATASGANKTVTIPNATGTVAVSASGPLSLDAAGNLTCATCVTAGGGGGGSAAVDSLNSLTGALTIANATTGGSTITINDATVAAKGIASFNSANFSVASGAVNTIQNISTTSSPTFTAINTNTLTPSAGLTLGATTQAFTLQGSASSTITATGGGFTTTMGFTGTPTGAVTYNFDRAATPGTYVVCTTAGNCIGAGGGVTTAGGTTNTLPKFTGSQTLGNSILTDNGSTVTIGGTLSVNTITPTSSLTLGATAQALTLQGNGSTTLTATSGGITNSLQFATPATTGKTITIPNATGTVAVSASGVLALDAAGNLTCATCLASAVTTLNSLTGALTIANATTGGSTITINDATTAAKGIASFNSTNFSVTSGTVNTTQNINTTATPTFTGVNTNAITPSAALTVGATGQNLTLQGNASTSIAATGGGFTTTLGFTGTPTGAVTYQFDRAAASGTYAICTSANNCSGVTSSLQQSYNASANPEIVVDATRGALTVRDASSAIGANLLEVQNNAGSTTYLGVTSAAVNLGSNVDLILSGTTAYISNPQSQTGSEALGQGAGVTGAQALAVGNGSLAANNGVSLGYQAGAASGAFGGPVSVGQGANADNWGVAIGQGAGGSGNDGVALGNGAIYAQSSISIGKDTVSSQGSIVIGNGSTSGGNNRIVLGLGATATADEQFIAGSNTAAISQAIFGNGVTNATPSAFKLQGTSGSGSNVAGANVTIASGQGTGNAAGGLILFQGSLAGSSGSILNGPTTLATLYGAGLYMGNNLNVVLSGTAASFSNNRGWTSSQSFGEGNALGGTQAVVIGDVSLANQNAVAVGYTANAGNESVSIGHGSFANPNSVAIGSGAGADSDSVVIGRGATSSGNSRIVLGRDATATANNQFVAGSNTVAITQAVFGNGVTNASPSAFMLQGTSASGSNTAGATVTIAGGQGTGTGTGGSVVIQGSQPGASGSTSNSLITMATFNPVTGLTLAGGQNLTLGSGAGVLSQTFTSATGGANAQALAFTNSNAAAGVTVQGVNLTPTNTTAPSSGTNTLNVFNFAAGGALGGSDTTNGLNFASATGYTNFLKTPTAVLTGAGAFTGLTGLTLASGNITTPGNISTSGSGTITVGTYASGTNTPACINSNTLANCSVGANNSVLYATSGGANIGNTGAGSTGQCLVATTAAAPSWGSCSGTFTLAGSSGVNQTISAGDTLQMAAGTNITTTGGATDKVTIATVANPTFATSVTTPLVTTASGDLNLDSATGRIYLGASDTISTNANLNISSGTVSGGISSLDLQSQGTGGITMGVNATNKTISIGATGSTAGATTLNLANSTGATQTVNVGSTQASSVTTINGGSAINLNGNVAVGSGKTFSGAGLSDCDSTNSKLLWDSTTSLFSCGTDRTSVTVRKSADQSRTSSTTMLNDSELTFAIGANDTFIFHLNVNSTFASAAGIKYAITAPAGATCNINSFGVDSAGNALELSNAGCGTVGTYGNIGGGPTADVEQIDGTVVNGSTAGTITYQFAQSVSSGTSTTIKAGSSLVAYKVSGADLAEAYYTHDNTISFGDVVRVDGSLKAGVKKTTGAYDGQAMGVISTNPGQVLSSTPTPGAKPVLLALAGRIPVKVTSENGPIEPGDYLTSSSIPGVAMKATRPGQVIGKALESYAVADPKAVGHVTLFANLSYYAGDGANGTAGAALLSDGSLSGSPANVATINDLALSINSLQGTQKEQQNELAGVQGRVAALEGALSKQATEQTLGVLSTQQANVAGNLTVGGITRLGNITVADTSISTTAGPLKLQPQANASVEIMGGKVVIDTAGNVAVKAALTTSKLNIAAGDPTNASIGDAHIGAGQSRVVVPTHAVTADSKIFVTAKTKTGHALSVTSQAAGESFTVETDTPEDKDVSFSWWVIN